MIIALLIEMFNIVHNKSLIEKEKYVDNPEYQKKIVEKYEHYLHLIAGTSALASEFQKEFDDLLYGMLKSIPFWKRLKLIKPKKKS